ncbi:MAG TPA: tetratricopeptide repeat protein [Acidimicrobiia bacterium]|nr:tetratricopeptide repeat protein [Acidimicrobiia bacterium]
MGGDTDDRLLAYLPRLVRDWSAHADLKQLFFDGTLVFADLSGFTGMTERLSAIGRRGAEEVSSIISDTFAALLEPVYEAGGSLIKFGGDALFLLFRGTDHEKAAAWSAWEMRTLLRRRSVVQASVGKIRLGMTTSIASGLIHAFMVGGARRELLLAGETVTKLMELEREATKGEALVSPATAAHLNRFVEQTATGAFKLVRRPPPSSTSEEIFHVASGAIEPFVPAAVLQRFDAGQTEPEHRRIAIGFVGVGGLDALVAVDSTAACEALDVVVKAVQEAATAQGAWVLATDVAPDGAKLIVTAGAPVATGHDEASLLVALTDVLKLDTPLHIRLGANHGTVFFGDIGPHYRRTLTVMGDTVNTAARLMAAADGASVLAARSMLDSRHVRFKHGNARNLKLRGRRQPLEVADIAGPVAEESPTSAVSGLVGREAELQTLEAMWSAAKSGTGAVAEITGPPGSGRSRLIGEFLTRCGDVRVVRAESSLHERSTPYALARRLFGQITGIDPDADDAAELLTALVNEKIEELLPDLPFVARAMGIAGFDERVIGATSPRFLQAITTRSLVSVLVAAGTGPMLVLIDDAHLADSASLAVLTQVSGRVPDLAWLVCVTLPEAGMLRWTGVEPVGVELGALDVASLTTLAESLTEDVPLSSHDLNMVVTRAAGNPLVLREIIDARRNNADIATIPTAVEGLMAMRIDRLEPSRRHQLEFASVLGTVFDSSLYETVAEAPASELIVGWDDGILQEAGDGRIKFANPVLRDVVYDRLPFARRVGLHGRVAAVLQVDPAAIDDLAFHLFRAEQWPEAVAAATAAGRDAEQHFASLEAVQWYETALDSATHSPISDAERAELWERIGDLKERAGQFEGASEAFARAESLASTAHARARLLIRRARPLEKLGRYSASLSSLTRAKKMAPYAHDVVAMATARYGGVRHYQGQHTEAIALAEEAIAASGEDETRPAEALALMILDMARSAAGQPIDGSASRRAMAMFEAQGDLDRQARVTNNLGMFAFFEGDWDEAERLYDESRRLFERIGDEVNASYGAGNLAEIWAAQGRHSEAEALFKEVRRIWRAADDKYGAAYIEGQLGMMAAFAGRMTEADERLQQSIELFREIGARSEVAEAACHLVETRLLAGDADGARRIIESYELNVSSTAGSPRLARLAAVIEWELGTSNCVAAITTALAKARQAASGLDELRLLEMASRSGLPLADPDRQNELTLQLGMVVSPVYPTTPPASRN